MLTAREWNGYLREFASASEGYYGQVLLEKHGLRIRVRKGKHEASQMVSWTEMDQLDTNILDRALEQCRRTMELAEQGQEVING